MKIGAGGLQAQVTHDEIASRAAQEARRPDYQQKPGRISDSTEPLNRDALNKTVEKLNDASRSFDLPLRFLPQEADEGKLHIEMQHTGTGRTKALDINEAGELINRINETKGVIVDQYI